MDFKYHAILAGLLPLSSNAFAGESQCFELSLEAQVWKGNPELLCVENETGQDPPFTITLRSDVLVHARSVAIFRYELLSSAACDDCNRNVFGLSHPRGSVFKTLEIAFDGRKESSGHEEGQLFIGDTAYFYRSLKAVD